MRRVLRRTLGLSVCIPGEQSDAPFVASPHRSRRSHLKGSELFETLPCESKASIRPRETGRTDFLACACFQRLRRGKCWIERLLILVPPLEGEKGRSPFAAGGAMRTRNEDRDVQCEWRERASFGAVALVEAGRARHRVPAGAEGARRRSFRSRISRSLVTARSGTGRRAGMASPFSRRDKHRSSGGAFCPAIRWMSTRATSRRRSMG